MLAACSAIDLAHELCLNQVQVEGDSEIIFKALSKGGMSSSSFRHIIQDIIALSSAFHCVSFCHTWRQGNRVAHSLARSACNFPPFQVWMEETALEIVSVYSDDIT